MKNASWMIVSFVCVVVAMFAFLSAFGAAGPEPAQVNRYELVTSHSGGVYIIDTTTGHVWERDTRYNWHSMGQPKVERDQ